MVHLSVISLFSAILLVCCLVLFTVINVIV